MKQAGLDLFTTFVQLREDGFGLPVTWTPDFWEKLVTGDRDRVVGAKHGAEPADFHPDEWEVHPRGDELLCLLTGAIEVILEEPDGERVVNLRGGQACIVPRGVWHRLIMRQPSDLLFITPSSGTQLRPVTA
jgi:mannose-6-phosphate isomerase-like protein (cupin superfamily)